MVEVCVIWGLRFWGLGFRGVRVLGFGVLGLGVRVWGFGGLRDLVLALGMYRVLGFRCLVS